MKKYKYSEIENYDNIGEIIKEKTVSFGSINEGKVVQITYTETFLSRDAFRVQIMFFKDGKRIENNDYPGAMFFDKDLKLSKKYYFDKDGKFSRKNGPAVIHYRKNGDIEVEKWFNHGKLHREEGKPAVIAYDDNNIVRKEIFYVNGKRTNLFGPSEIYYDEYGKSIKKMYFKYGKSVSADTILNKIRKVTSGNFEKSINRLSNIKTIEEYEKIAKYFKKDDVLMLIESKKIMLKLEGKI